jgi:hypothetical protein
MVMRFNMKYRIASILAVLLAITIMNFTTHIAQADEHLISLPQDGFEPITLRIANGAVNAENKKVNEILQVFVGAVDKCCTERTPVAGSYAYEDNLLTFKPAFGFVEGMDYVVRIHTTSIGEKLVPFNIQSELATIDATVTNIYPSGDVIPENTLRFYIHFSTPMQPHVSFDHIKLVDQDGIADEAAFMRFKQELWNEDRTRLTVLFDPGRIKREVATNLELGPALQEGKQYRLVVQEGWMPVQGKTSLSAFSKHFTVSNALRELPDETKWQIKKPRLNTKDALEINFDRQFDFGLLGKSIKIKNMSGTVLLGDLNISGSETIWRFEPVQAWTDDKITINVDPNLEDVAGNNFKDLLDHRAGTDTKEIEKISIAVDLSS